MCNNKENTNCENCIKDILKVILLLQQSVCPNDACLETCDKGFLGHNCSQHCNTRPIVLYTCCAGNSTALSIPISKDPNEKTTSNIFRLEKLDDCCATFRVLVKATDGCASPQYVATNSFFTINLDCVCILRCLDDAFVECI